MGPEFRKVGFVPFYKTNLAALEFSQPGFSTQPIDIEDRLDLLARLFCRQLRFFVGLVLWENKIVTQTSQITQEFRPGRKSYPFRWK